MTTKTLYLPAAAGWVDTEVDVTTGDTLYSLASGKSTLKSDTQICTYPGMYPLQWETTWGNTTHKWISAKTLLSDSVNINFSSAMPSGVELDLGEISGGGNPGSCLRSVTSNWLVNDIDPRTGNSYPFGFAVRARVTLPLPTYPSEVSMDLYEDWKRNYNGTGRATITLFDEDGIEIRKSEDATFGTLKDWWNKSLSFTYGPTESRVASIEYLHHTSLFTHTPSNNDVRMDNIYYKTPIIKAIRTEYEFDEPITLTKVRAKLRGTGFYRWEIVAYNQYGTISRKYSSTVTGDNTWQENQTTDGWEALDVKRVAVNAYCDGDEFLDMAEAHVCQGEFADWYWADGVASVADISDSLLVAPGHFPAAVVAKIGAGGTPFTLGTEHLDTVNATGRLFVATNDESGEHTDNQGGFGMLLKVNPPIDFDCFEPSNEASPQDLGYAPAPDTTVGLKMLEGVMAGTTDRNNGNNTTCVSLDSSVLENPTHNHSIVIGASFDFEIKYDPERQNQSGHLGNDRSHTDQELIQISGTSPTKIVEYTKGDGTKITYTESGANVFTTCDGVFSTLTYDSVNDDYTVTDLQGSTSLFDNTGKILEKKHFTGQTKTYTYNTNQKLEKIENSDGQYIQLSYISNPGQVDDGKLWRVGDQASTGLDTTTPTGRYIEFAYTAEKSNGVATGNGAVLSSITDLRGNTWQYEYYGEQVGENDTNLVGKLLRRKSPTLDTTGNGTTDTTHVLEDITYTYTNGDLTSLSKDLGDAAFSVSYDYNTSGQTQVQVADQANRYYHKNGIVYGVEDPTGAVLARAIDGTNYRTTSKFDVFGNEQQYQWSVDGKNLTSVTNENGEQTTFNYNVNNTVDYSLDSLGRKTTYIYGDMGQPRLPTEVQVFDTDGTTLLEWRMLKYDTLGRTTHEAQVKLNATDPVDITTEDSKLLRRTTRQYVASGTNKGLLESITHEDLSDPSNNQSTTYTYDGIGRVIQTSNTSMFGSCEKTYTIYDDGNNVVASICNYDVGANGVTSFSVAAPPANAADAALLAQETIDANTNNVTTYTYDPMGRRIITITNAGRDDEQSNLTVYDSLGRVARTIGYYDPTGVTNPYVAARSAFDQGTTGDKNRITDTAYNQRGQVRKVTDPNGNVTLYGYDIAGYVVKTVAYASDDAYDNDTTGDPDLSDYEPVNNAFEEDLITEQTYDAAGRVVRTIGPRGDISFTGYDKLGRVVKTISNASVYTYYWQADPEFANYVPFGSPDQDHITTTEYDAAGRVIRTTNVDGQNTLYGYDALNRRVRTIQNASNPNYDTSNDPDLSAYTISNATDEDLVSYITYDDQGRTIYTEDLNGNRNWMGYDGLGRQTKTIGNAVGTATDGSANDPRSSSYVESTNTDEDLISHTHYDSDGRVKWTQDTLGRYTLYGYDLTNRQVRVIRNASDPNYDTSLDSELASYTASSNADEDLITQTIYDDEGRVLETIDHRGNVTRSVYDSIGRRTRTIQNYVVQAATDPADWVWDDANTRWEDGANTAIDHGADNDQNLISDTMFNADGRVQNTRRPDGQLSYQVYDQMGRTVKSIQNYVAQGATDPADWVWANDQWEDGAGVAISHGADNDQNLISETTYNVSGQVTQTRNVRGTVTSFAYDRAGRRVSVTQADGSPQAITSYTCFDKVGRTLRTIRNWDGTGNPDETDSNDDWVFNPATSERRDHNLITEFTYDKLGRRLSATDAEGHQTATVYHKDGRVDTQTDAAGVVTKMIYDQLRRPIRTIRGYVAQGATDPANWIWSNANTRWEDGAGNPISHDADFDQNIIVDTVLDKASRRTSQRDPRGHQNSYTYDQLNRRTGMTNPLNNTWTTTYTDLAGGGNQITVQDALGYDTERAFDRAGRLNSINYSNSAGGSGLLSLPDVDLSYDIAGNRISMLETTGATTIRQTDYFYDAARRLTQVDFDSDGDTIINDSVQYSYDLGGLKTAMVIPGDMTLTYDYNDRGQLINMSSQVGTDTHSMGIGYDGLGRRILDSHAAGYKTTYAYDNNGRLLDLHHEQGGETVARYAFTLDSRGNRTQTVETTLDDTPSTETIYPSDNRVSVVRGTWIDNSGTLETTEQTAELALSFTGSAITLTLPNSTDGGIVDIYAGLSFWGSRDTYHPSATSEDLTIVFNREGDHTIRLVHRGDKQNGSAGYRIGLVQAVIETALSMQTLLYAYDSQGRLLSADTYAGIDTAATPIREEAFSFDTASNRTSASLDGVTTNYSYNAANQLTSDGSTSYSYDANGNLTTGGNTWYRNNKLANASGIDYAYNGLGQRVAQTANSVTTQYLLDVQPGLANVIRKDDGSNTDYFTHNGSTIWQHNGVDAWHFALPDGLGSVRHVLDENLNTVYETDYSAYGETFNSTGVNPMAYGYTGQPLDANGLAYHRARYYDASMGVWNSQDPLELMNRYGYVDGNPISMVDPSGYSCATPSVGSPAVQTSISFSGGGNRRSRVDNAPTFTRRQEFGPQPCDNLPLGSRERGLCLQSQGQVNTPAPYTAPCNGYVYPSAEWYACNEIRNMPEPQPEIGFTTQCRNSVENVVTLSELGSAGLIFGRERPLIDLNLPLGFEVGFVTGFALIIAFDPDPNSYNLITAQLPCYAYITTELGVGAGQDLEQGVFLGGFISTANADSMAGVGAGISGDIGGYNAGLGLAGDDACNSTVFFGFDDVPYLGQILNNKKDPEPSLSLTGSYAFDTLITCEAAAHILQLGLDEIAEIVNEAIQNNIR